MRVWIGRNQKRSECRKNKETKHGGLHEGINKSIWRNEVENQRLRKQIGFEGQIIQRVENNILRLKFATQLNRNLSRKNRGSAERDCLFEKGKQVLKFDGVNSRID